MKRRVAVALGIACLAAGISAVIVLRRGPASTPAVVQAPAPKPVRTTGCGYIPPAKPLVWLFSHQNDDGSWGSGAATLEGRRLGRTGVTALALLPLFNTGYFPYSKAIDVFKDDDPWGDEAKGRTSGGQVLQAVEWLLLQQRSDGTFGDQILDQALSTFALAELYGLTGRGRWKPAAQHAVDALLRMQNPEGSWDGVTPTIWAILALNSARQSELDVDRDKYGRALASWTIPAHPGDALTLALRKKPDASAAVERLIEDARDRAPENGSFWYLGTAAVFVQDGPRSRSRLFPEERSPGRAWNRWGEILRGKLGSFNAPVAEVGTPGDRVVGASLRMLAWELFCGYGAAFIPR